MKSLDIVHTLFLIVVFAVMGWGYFEFSRQQQWTDKKIEAVKNDVNGISTAVRKMDGQWSTMVAQSEDYATGMKSIEDKVNSSETQRQDLVSKVADLARDVEELKKNDQQTAPAVMVTPVPATEAMPVTEERASVPEATAGSPEEGASLDAPTTVELGEIPVQK